MKELKELTEKIYCAEELTNVSSLTERSLNEREGGSMQVEDLLIESHHLFFL